MYAASADNLQNWFLKSFDWLKDNLKLKLVLKIKLLILIKVLKSLSVYLWETVKCLDEKINQFKIVCTENHFFY